MSKNYENNTEARAIIYFKSQLKLLDLEVCGINYGFLNKTR